MTHISPYINNPSAETGVLNLQKKAAELKAANGSIEEAHKKAQEFEGVFLGQMIRHMYKNIEVNDLFGGGYAEETFRDLLLDEYGNQMAKAGGIGIADSVKRELIAIQAMQGGR